ncbi:MAG: LysR family transcriptional regulator [Clostridiales bacterium]|nr:LysR family transcriptional regulator [Clostridiales bacterium]
MTYEQLEYFVITAKHLNFSEAAKELYITQPAISHQISALERELGTRLFTRSTRRVLLTKSGELFLEDAKRMLDMMESARERIYLADDSSELSLHIAYLLAPCQSFLPSLVRQFRHRHPQVNITLTRMDAHNISDALPQEKHDLFFSVSRDFDTQNEYASRTLFTDTFCLICADDHPCATSSRIDFDKIASETFFMLDPEIGPFMAKQTLQVCRAHHFQPHDIRYLDSMDEVLFCTEAGLGVTILPSKNQIFYPSSLVYLPLDGPHAQMTVGVAWLQRSENPAISWFLQMLDETECEGKSPV